MLLVLLMLLQSKYGNSAFKLIFIGAREETQEKIKQ